MTSLQSQPDRVSVQKSGGAGDVGNLGDVHVRRIEVNRTEEIAAINKRIAEAQEKILEAERLRKDEAILAAEARKLAETSRSNAAEAAKIVQLQEKLKQTSLEEEQELERKRAMVHERAVAAENARANARAEEVLYHEQEKEALKLVHKHELSAEHAAKIVKAYELVKNECERRRWMLQSDSDVEVHGELPSETPALAQIRVEVQPQKVPESVRIAPSAQPQPTAKLAEVVEHVPQHKPIHIAPQAAPAKVIREEVETINVRREDAIVSGTQVEAVTRESAQKQGLSM